MKRFSLAMLAGAVTALLAGIAPPPSAVASDASAGGAAEQTESERLNAWFDRIEQEDLERFPMTKAQRGIIDADYGRWNDVSDAFAVETYALGQERLAHMRGNFDFDALDPSARLSWRLFEYQRESDAQNFPFRRHHFVFHQMSGAHSNTPVFLTTVHRIIDATTAEAWISRAGSVGELFATLIEESQVRFEMGVQPPVWVYDHVIDTSRNVISGAPFDEGEPNTVWESFEQSVHELELEEADKSRLLARGREALLSWVPAYESLIEAMEAQKAEAMAGDGAWRLPDGEAFYAARLASFTTTELSAEQIHRLGLDNVERIRGEMRAIMAEVGFAGSLPEFFVFMNEDERFYYPGTEAGREAYLAEAAAIIDRITERLPEYFLTLPRHELEVRRVEAFRERSAGKAFYSRPAPDGSRPGIYYANLYNMADMPIYQMEALAYHEGNPGHHMQLSITMDLDGVPAFRRFGGFTAYIEGWGLYTEYLPLEMGFYEDPYSNFGRLAMELSRAARLVVDTGLHHQRWSREEAIDWLAETTPNSRGDATRAIERYIVMPGQATAYMIGMIRILELRESARERLGERFDIRGFHDVVLRDGAVPLDMLEELVDRWVEETLET